MNNQEISQNNLKITILTVGNFVSNCAIISSDLTKEAIIIDPGEGIEDIKELLKHNNWKVTKILHTHAHIDHIATSKSIKELTEAPIFLHQDDEEIYQSLTQQGIMFGVPVDTPGKIDHFLTDGERIGFTHFSSDHPNKDKLENLLTTMHTPGHAPGSCCFFSDFFGPPILFSGDTLFQGSIGRTDLPGGDYDTIINSIKEKLWCLPDDTRVIPGHGPMTTIAQEKEFNPFLQ